MKIEIKVLNKDFYQVNKIHESYYDLPQYQTSGSAGMDLRCTEDITIYPGETKMIPTGLAIWIGSSFWPILEFERFEETIGYKTHREPIAVEGQIRPRSGLGTKGLILANTIGVIDEDYQGELKIASWNRLSSHLEALYHYERETIVEHNVIHLKAGDRIAQLVFLPIIKAQWAVVDEFSNNTLRGEGGFGHTGD